MELLRLLRSSTKSFNLRNCTSDKVPKFLKDPSQMEKSSKNISDLLFLSNVRKIQKLKQSSVWKTYAEIAGRSQKLFKSSLFSNCPSSSSPKDHFSRK